MGTITGSLAEFVTSQEGRYKDDVITAYEVRMNAQDLEIQRLTIVNNRLCDIKTELQVQLFYLQEQLSHAQL